MACFEEHASNFSAVSLFRQTAAYRDLIRQVSSSTTKNGFPDPQLSKTPDFFATKSKADAFFQLLLLYFPFRTFRLSGLGDEKNQVVKHQKDLLWMHKTAFFRTTLNFALKLFFIHESQAEFAESICFMNLRALLTRSGWDGRPPGPVRPAPACWKPARSLSCAAQSETSAITSAIKKIEGRRSPRRTLFPKRFE